MVWGGDKTTLLMLLEMDTSSFPLLGSRKPMISVGFFWIKEGGVNILHIQCTAGGDVSCNLERVRFIHR